MKKKNSCCDFFKRVFSKKHTTESSEEKTSEKSEKFSQEKTEIVVSKKTVSTEPKHKSKHSKKDSQGAPVSESNSIFYDKNSALVDSVDKNKAIDNLEVAFAILNHSDEEYSQPSFGKFNKEQFTKVVKDINFKEILGSDESIVLSERT